jgi:hypothetical protein
MSSHKPNDYEAFARDCLSLAKQANTPALRQRLMDMARDWMRASMEEQDASASVLLRARPERPCRRRAEQRDELAALHSITSSARASTEEGMSRPSVLAVRILTTSSYLIGVCTGRLAGASPLRMRAT